MRTKTREQRRRDTGDFTVKVIIAVLLVAFGLAMASPLLDFLSRPEPEAPTPEEMAARAAAREEYYRVLNMGMSEWSAQEAARLALEAGNGEAG